MVWECFVDWPRDQETVAVEEQGEVHIGSLVAPLLHSAPEDYLKSQSPKFLQPHNEPQFHHQVVLLDQLLEFLEEEESLSSLLLSR
jgi:hypothetical protein